MNMMHSSEISLRRAVFTAQKNIGNGENLVEKIKNQALKQLDVVQQAEGLFSSAKNAKNLQSVAIHAAFDGLELAYYAISSELSEAKFKRKRFVEECETHLASFSISTQKELNEYYLEELAIHHFIQIIDNQFPDIKPYLGMSLHQSKEFSNERYYAVMPFYRMSMSLEQNSVIASKLDTHRQGIFLFLKTGLPLQYYYEKYQKYSRLWLQIQGLSDSNNYLNHLKAPRFIISALANLLWNLQHPVDANTGIPLSIDKCVLLCNKASMFLNDLLNPSQFKDLPKLDTRCKKIIRSLCQIELLIKSLQKAYEDDHLHEINLSDISKHMHSALRIMSNKIMELIYRDSLASEKLVGRIMIMGELLMHNYELYDVFHPLQVNCKPPFINPQAKTLIDVLSLFAHQTPQKRKQIWHKMMNSGLEYHIQFAHQLKDFHNTFLNQFEDIVKENLRLKAFNEKVASHFIPLILMVMESFTVFRDTRPKDSYEFSAEHESHKTSDDAHDRKQRHLILNDAASNKLENHSKYYSWSLSNFIQSQSPFHASLDMLLSKQNQMRLKTLQMDILAFKLTENRTLLLEKSFKNESLSTLNDICVFYTHLLEMFNNVESKMQADSKLQRDQKRILQPMLDDLEASVVAIQKSIAIVNTIMNATQFEDQQRARVQERVGLSLLSSTRHDDNEKPQEPIEKSKTITSTPILQSKNSFFKSPPKQSQMLKIAAWTIGLIGGACFINSLLLSSWLSLTMAFLCLCMEIGLYTYPPSFLFDKKDLIQFSI